MATFRISSELAALLELVIARCGIDDARVFRAANRRIKAGLVEDIEIAESLYKSGEIVKNVPFELPCQASEYRRKLAIVLTGEAAKPIYRSYGAEAGIVSPTAPTTIEEAALIAAYVEGE